VVRISLSPDTIQWNAFNQVAKNADKDVKVRIKQTGQELLFKVDFNEDKTVQGIECYDMNKKSVEVFEENKQVIEVKEGTIVHEVENEKKGIVGNV
jgi:hypothetical protein